MGLALSGGGARGYAHIGVIKVLEKNNIPINFIAGSSIGALIGALYSFFNNSKKLEETTLSYSWKEFFSLIDPSFKGGLIGGEKLEKFIAKTIKNSTFKKLKIPFVAIATDFKSGQPVELSKGNVALSVRASMSFPILFKPVFYRRKLLWDGGLSVPVPVDAVIKMGADIVIAVNLYNKSSTIYKKPLIKRAYSIILNSIETLQYHLAKEYLKPANIVIQPNIENLGLIGLDKFLKARGKKIILKGEKAAKLALPKIKKQLNI